MGRGKIIFGVLLFAIVANMSAKAEGERPAYTTPYYEVEISTSPVRIARLAWDLQGLSNHQRLTVPEIPGTKWASSLFVGADFFTDTLAGAAQSWEWTDANHLILRDIALMAGLTADWQFTFFEDYFEHEITWKASQPVSSMYDLGHQWATHRLSLCGDENAQGLAGDQGPYSDYMTLRDEEYVFQMDFVEGSSPYKENRYCHGNGMVWQGLFSGGTSSLPAGNHGGGRWRCQAVRPSSLQLGPNDASIGYFESPGEYLKDFFFLKTDGLWHLFYNVGIAGATQDWQDAGNEKKFGHATSPDLVNWTILDPVLPVVPNSWEGQVVSAPSILKTSDTWQMIYTGFDDRIFGLQQVGLAQSADLFNWTRRPENPLYQGPAWTNWQPDQWADCRDAHIIAAPDAFYMYTMVSVTHGQGAIAIAKSQDLLNWQDLGPAVQLEGTPESPVVFERNGTYYLITTSNAQGCFISDEPGANDWTRIPFEFPPAPGFWSAFEVFQDGDRTIAAAFRWTNMGNYIRFWEMEWEEDKPVVRYTAMPPSGVNLPHKAYEKDMRLKKD